MKFITFDKEKCDNCYKCLRVCPTKAIAFTGDSRRIIDDLCIKCGLCKASCVHHALSIQNDKYKIKKALQLGEKIAVSLAPSYAGAFHTTGPGQMISALKQLGFQFVEETAVAAEQVSICYEEYIHTMKPLNLITSCCPSANLFLEQRYPELIHLVAPVVSPMIAHGRILKRRLGPEWTVAFIGPCLAKKAEADEIKGSVDYVLTFNELNQWLQECEIDWRSLVPDSSIDRPTIRGAAYPMGACLLDSNFDQKINADYRYVRAEGIDRLTDIYENLRENKIENYCIEVNMCSGSCNNGPDMPDTQSLYYQRRDWMLDYLEPLAKTEEVDHPHVNTYAPIMTRSFHEKRPFFPFPSEDEIRRTLASMGKYKEEDQLNCGACGYSSCMDKVIAIHRGLAEKTMCIPYMKGIAEGLQSAIFQNSPNPIFILDSHMHLNEYNPSFEKVFHMYTPPLNNINLFRLFPEAFFEAFSDPDVLKDPQKIHITSLEKTFLANVVLIENQHVWLCILTDLTLSETQRVELALLKEQTLSSCQHLIDQQMRMVQEIAGLLGESTAEAKVNLNRLKELIHKGDDLSNEHP